METAPVAAGSGPSESTGRLRRVADSLWFNALWFQSLWFTTVLGREALLPLALALLTLHLWLARDRRLELRQFLVVGGLGIGVDAALSGAGIFQFHAGVLVPLWLCCLWLAFSAILGRSLAYLATRYWWCALAGALAFPLNYWAGQRLGAVEFGYSLPVTLTTLAVVWALVLPLMFYLTRRLASTGAPGARA